MRVAVVGCGYVGLVSGVGLASVGHEVVGVEVEPGRRRRIAAGATPFHEPGLSELLASTLSSGRFRVSSDLDVARDADVVLLAVQTPPGPSGAIDLGFLEAAAGALARTFAAAPRRRRVVATRSTVVPGTADGLLAPILAVPDADGGSATAVASNPEFLREGSAVSDFLHPDRVVVGCHEPWATALMEQLYGPLGAPVVATTPATAELSKYASNALLATLVSFSNEIAEICEDTPGVDVADVQDILHLDRRLRPVVGGQPVVPGILSYLRAGCGYGGSCLPKDLSALIAYRHGAGGRAPLLEAVRAVNEHRPARLVAMAERALGGLAGRRVAVLGLAFKAGTDDLRDSPGLAAVESLLAHGADVAVYDPLVAPAALGAYTDRGVRVLGSLREACSQEACLVTTNDPAFAELTALLGADAPHRPLVVDGRRVLAPEGFPDGVYLGIGRGGPQSASRTAAARSSGVPMSR